MVAASYLLAAGRKTGWHTTRGCTRGGNDEEKHAASPGSRDSRCLGGESLLGRLGRRDGRRAARLREGTPAPQALLHCTAARDATTRRAPASRRSTVRKGRHV